MNYSEWNKSVNQKRLDYQGWKKASGVKILSLGTLTSLLSPKLSFDEKKATTNYVSTDADDLDDRLRNE